MPERRRLDRRTFSYYMRLMNENTGELVGHLADISTGGFKMESLKPIPPNVDFKFRIELTSEVANVPFMVFAARAANGVSAITYDQISSMLVFKLWTWIRADAEIFSRMFERYGSKTSRGNNQDYLWR